MADKYKILDSLISKYVRLRDLYQSDYRIGYGFLDNSERTGKCFICGKRISYNEAQNCHYIPRKHIATRFNLINCNAGCISCNCFDLDHEKRYREALVKKYGKDTVEELEQLKNITIKLSISDLREMEQMMREKIKLLENKNKL